MESIPCINLTEIFEMSSAFIHTKNHQIFVQIINIPQLKRFLTTFLLYHELFLPKVTISGL